MDTQHSDLARFAEEFHDEAHLRDVLVDLLTKSGAKGVRNTHGRNERGKDIIFYQSTGLSGDVLYACVVKNDRISGRADSKSGAQTVLNQAQQALREPYVNRSTGMDEQAHSVYIMSPHECTTDAIESIRTQLRDNARRVEFICGIDLLKLFQQHWPDFLRFESAILTRYLTALRNGLVVDNALISLLTRHNANAGLRPFETFYVPVGIEMRLDSFEVPDVRTPAKDALRIHLSYDELKQVAEQLRYWRQVLASPELTGEDESTLKTLLTFINTFASNIKQLWDKSLTHRRIRKLQHTSVEECKLAITNEDDLLYSKTITVLTRIQQQITSISHSSSRLLRAAHRNVSAQELIWDSSLVTLSSAYDYVGAIPGLLKHTRGPVLSLHAEDIIIPGKCVLLVGPPGSGKTSFCRWSTLRAIEAFSNDPQKPLPVYVPAHRLTACAANSTFEETFMSGVDLSDVTSGRTNKPIVLFIDGLDEVPDREQQKRIITLLKSGLEANLEIAALVTSRPYVWGTWLNWLPRVHMAELSADQQVELTEKWLGESAKRETFFEELSRSPALRKLMGVPLLATLILNLYKKTPTIPENKASLYRTFVELYCGAWDTAKGGINPGKFRTEQKLRPLSDLAYRMHLQHQTDCLDSSFQRAVVNTMPRVAPGSSDLLSEIIQDGILVRSGHHLLFAHLSFQEYLAAQFLASDPLGQRPTQALRTYLRGEDWWKDVVEFYIISRDDPASLDDWIGRIALEVRKQGATPGQARSGGDLSHRLDTLAITMFETFPGCQLKFPYYQAPPKH